MSPLKNIKDSTTFWLFCAVSVLAALYVGWQIYQTATHKSARQQACSRVADPDNDHDGPAVGISVDQAVCDGSLPPVQPSQQ